MKKTFGIQYDMNFLEHVPAPKELVEAFEKRGGRGGGPDPEDLQLDIWGKADSH